MPENGEQPGSESNEIGKFPEIDPVTIASNVSKLKDLLTTVPRERGYVVPFITIFVDRTGSFVDAAGTDIERDELKQKVQLYSLKIHICKNTEGVRTAPFALIFKEEEAPIIYRSFASPLIKLSVRQSIETYNASIENEAEKPREDGSESTPTE